MVRVEEWLSIEEGIKRHEAIKKMKEHAREIEYESPNIVFREWKKEKNQEGEEMS